MGNCNCAHAETKDDQIPTGDLAGAKKIGGDAKPTGAPFNYLVRHSDIDSCDCKSSLLTRCLPMSHLQSYRTAEDYLLMCTGQPQGDQAPGKRSCSRHLVVRGSQEEPSRGHQTVSQAHSG